MEPDIRYLIEQGKAFFRNQAFKKAEEALLKIVANKNEFADVYNMLGMIAHQTGQFGRAVSFFQKAIKINPNYTEALLNLSVLYNDLGEYKLSRQVLAKSKKKSEEDRMAPFIKGKLANKHAEIGDLYRGAGLHHEAVEEFKKALDLAPHFLDIRYRLGISFREDEKKKEALKEFQTIVKEKPAYTDAHIQMGVTLYSLGKKGEAHKVWTRLARKNPRNQLVRMYLQLSDEQKGKKKK